MHQELTVPSRATCLAQVRRAVLDVSGHGPFASGEAQLVALAVEEAVANVMEHAFTPGVPEGQQQIQVLLDLDGVSFRARVRDAGRRFDPTVVPEVDIRRHVDQGRKGGLGLYLIRRIMDEVTYTFRPDQHNELVLVKYFDRRARPARGLRAQREGR